MVRCPGATSHSTRSWSRTWTGPAPRTSAGRGPHQGREVGGLPPGECASRNASLLIESLTALNVGAEPGRARPSPSWSHCSTTPPGRRRAASRASRRSCPNYNLRDDFTVLDVSLWWTSDDADCDRSLQVSEHSYGRGSRAALTEFAPGAVFYANGYRVEVDAVEIGPAGRTGVSAGCAPTAAGVPTRPTRHRFPAPGARAPQWPTPARCTRSGTVHSVGGKPPTHSQAHLSRGRTSRASSGSPLLGSSGK